MNLTKGKPPLEVGDRYVALPGSEMQRACDFPTPLPVGENAYGGPIIFRLDERHPCGALEFVVIAVNALSADAASWPQEEDDRS